MEQTSDSGAFKSGYKRFRGELLQLQIWYSQVFHDINKNVYIECHSCIILTIYLIYNYYIAQTAINLKYLCLHGEVTKNISDIRHFEK